MTTAPSLALRGAPSSGGALDTTHLSVVAVVTVDDPANPTKGETCTGTVLSVKGNTGYVLTAAHCFTDVNPAWTTLVVTANDYGLQKFADGHPITDHVVHPSYNPTSHLYDFALLKFEGAAGLPTTSVLPPAEDDLAAGSKVTLVGYGFTLEDGDAGFNTARRSFTAPLDMVLTDQLTVDETTAKGGQCQGDSGGPLLYEKGGVVYVAGIISAGAADCTGVGLSNRASLVHDDFVQGYLDGKPLAITPTCSTCQSAATRPGGACGASLGACGKSTACNEFLDCDAKCGDAACHDACRSAHASGAKLYDAVTGCVCTTGCAAECASDVSCGGDGGVAADAGPPAASPDAGDAIGTSPGSRAMGRARGPGGSNGALGALATLAMGLVVRSARRRRGSPSSRRPAAR